MDTYLELYHIKITGGLSIFDRMIFKGHTSCNKMINFEMAFHTSFVFNLADKLKRLVICYVLL